MDYSVYLCGDTHGLIDIDTIKKLKPEKQENNLLIQLGDFGCIWHYDPNKNSECLDKWVEFMHARHFSLFVVPGNHENYAVINELPDVKNPLPGIECVCKVHLHKDEKIYFLTNPELNIDTIKFLVIRGATSQDRILRVENVSWWKEEELSQKERKRIVKYCEKNNWSFDYILSHTPPVEVIEIVKPSYVVDAVGIFMQELIDRGLTFKEWHFAHLHKDVFLKIGKRKYIGHYKKIGKLM